MSWLRNKLRGLYSRELGVLGAELDSAEELNDDLAEQLASLRERFNRLQARVGMATARSARRGEQGGGEDSPDLAASLQGARSTPEEELFFRQFPELREGRH